MSEKLLAMVTGASRGIGPLRLQSVTQHATGLIGGHR